MAVAVQLTAEDFMVAATKAGVRQLRAIKYRRVGSDHGGKSRRHIAERLAHSFIGELGEISVSRLTGFATQSLHDEMSSGDVGKRYEVKATEHDDGCLLIYPKSKDHTIFVLVVIHGLMASVRGWIRAADGKRDEYWKESDPPCWFVPQSALQSIESLPES